MGVNSVFSTLANWFDWPVERVRLGCFLLLALLIDVSGVACLLYATKTQVKRLTKTLTETFKDENEAKTFDSKSLNCIETLDAKTFKVSENVCSGLYGSKPILRRVIEGEETSFKVVRNVFDELLKVGKLVQRGRCYELVDI